MLLWSAEVLLAVKQKGAWWGWSEGPLGLLNFLTDRLSVVRFINTI